MQSEVEKLVAELREYATDWRTRAASKDVVDRAASLIESLYREREKLREAVKPLIDAARGLSHGEDWNNGTHAKAHGYRQKLLDALPEAKAALAEQPQ